MKQLFNPEVKFYTEHDVHIPDLEIAYHTFGENRGDNVMWIFHALTANSDPTDWWKGLIGSGKLLDPSKHYIVCANILGSCYGTTGPITEVLPPNLFGKNFPFITIRDMVSCHKLLANHLRIDRIKLGLGGSMGGYQLLEWMIDEPTRFSNAALIATSAYESAWGRAIHEAQRIALKSDPTFEENTPSAGQNGLAAARAFGMVTYRSYDNFELNQGENTPKAQDFKVARYIQYQSEKIQKRFDPYTYYCLSLAMDSHDYRRGRKNIDTLLSRIETESQIVGISTDILCPPQEQDFLKKILPNSEVQIIESNYGHDGFLTESLKISQILRNRFQF